MSAEVICISRSLAAGGEEIGQGVAARLGFRVIDSEIIERAAEKAELDPARVAQTEQRQSLIRRLIASMVPAAVTAKLGARYYAAYPVVALTLGQSREERLRGLIREVIEEVAAEGRAVIVAHAASMALAGRDGVLRVLITASPEERAERLVWASGLDSWHRRAGGAQLRPGARPLFPALLPSRCRTTDSLRPRRQHRPAPAGRGRGDHRRGGAGPAPP